MGPTGGFVRQLTAQMGGPLQIGDPMQPRMVAPGGIYTATPLQPMMAAPGGSYTAPPMHSLAAPGYTSSSISATKSGSLAPGMRVKYLARSNSICYAGALVGRLVGSSGWSVRLDC